MILAEIEVRHHGPELDGKHYGIAVECAIYMPNPAASPDHLLPPLPYPFNLTTPDSNPSYTSPSRPCMP